MQLFGIIFVSIKSNKACHQNQARPFGRQLILCLASIRRGEHCQTNPDDWPVADCTLNSQVRPKADNESEKMTRVRLVGFRHQHLVIMKLHESPAFRLSQRDNWLDFSRASGPRIVQWRRFQTQTG